MANEFVARNGLIALDDSQVSGSLRVTNGITGSLFGTASWAQNAVSSSYVLNAVSASFSSQSISASFASTSSLSTRSVITASAVGSTITFTKGDNSTFGVTLTTANADTASYVLSSNVDGPLGRNSVLSSSLALTASSADNFTVRGTLTAQTVVAQVITSSTDFVTGSTRFGSLLTNTHAFTGSIGMTGSLSVFGNVGIGTTSPSARLHITGSTNPILRIESQDGSDTTPTVYIEGNRGLGSPATATLVELRANDDFRGRGIHMTVSGSNTKWFAGVPYTGNGYSIGYDASSNGLPWYAASSSLFINTSRNVGIGTTTPSERFHVSGNIIAQSNGLGDSTSAITVRNNNGTQVLSLGAAGGIIMSNSARITNNSTALAPYIEVYNNADGNFRIQSSTSYNLILQPDSRNVGIGTLTPNAKLDVSGSAIITGSLVVTQGITGSLFGTASWANNAVTSSNALTASFVLNAVSSSFSSTSSLTLRGIITASGAGSTITFTKGDNSTFGVTLTTATADTASYVLSSNVDGPLGRNSVLSSSNALTASYALNAVSSSQSQNSVTASYVLNAVSSSFSSLAGTANTASYVLNAVSSSFASSAATSNTASYVLNAVSSSFSTLAATANTASFVLNTVSSSFASTASSADNFTVRGTLTAQTIVAQVITSSTDFVTGSTRFGSLLTNTHAFTGSVGMTGSLSVMGGNVGIDTTAPFSKFTVLGAASNSTSQISVINSEGGHLIIRSGISGITNQGATFATANVDGTNENTRLVISATGNIGIGTINPTQRLHISGGNALHVGPNDTAGVYYQITTTGLSGGGLFGVEGSSAGSTVTGTTAYATVISSTSSGTVLQLGTAGVVRATINTSGNMGIGLTSPSARLHVSGSTTANLLVGNSDLFVSASGNVGIGTTTPAYKLHIVGGDVKLPNNYKLYFGDVAEALGFSIGSDGASNNMLITNNNNATLRVGTGGTSGHITFTPNSSESVRFTGTGNVGIGTTSPNARLDVNGNAIITGSLTVTQGITSSLFGTSSWSNNAITASYVLNAVSSSFASQAGTSNTASYVLNAISASFASTASFVTSSAVFGPFGANSVLSASFAVSAAWAPSAGTTVFPFTGSALFTGSMSLTGSYSITGSVTASSFVITDRTGSTQYTYGYLSTAASSINVISSVPTGSFRAAFYNYVATSGSNARAGQISSVWFLTTCSFAEYITTDIGTTSQVDMYVRISGSFVQLMASSSANWIIDTSVNLV